MTKLAFQDIIPSLNTKESNLTQANSATDNGVVFRTSGGICAKTYGSEITLCRTMIYPTVNERDRISQVNLFRLKIDHQTLQEVKIRLLGR